MQYNSICVIVIIISDHAAVMLCSYVAAYCRCANAYCQMTLNVDIMRYSFQQILFPLPRGITSPFAQQLLMNELT